MSILQQYELFNRLPQRMAVMPAAAVVTASLFTVMQGLVAHNDVTISPERPHIRLSDFNVSPPVEEARPRDRLIKPEPAELEPPTTAPVPSEQTPLIGIPVTPTTPIITPDNSFKGFLGLTDGDAVPLVRIQPDYPRLAQARGIEGWVVVRFDITPSGSVVNPVVEVADPVAVFDAAALKAVLKFKYQPKIIGGEAVMQPGIKYRFSFTLQN